MSLGFEWLPNIGLGDIRFGESINLYISSLGVYLDPDDERLQGWVRYKVPNEDILVDVENNKVVSITSYSKFYCNGINLIGLSIVRLNDLLNTSNPEVGMGVEYDDGEIQFPVDYDDEGLQVWKLENNLIVSASCYKRE